MIPAYIANGPLASLWDCNILIEGTSGERVISICDAVDQHSSEIDSLQTLHALNWVWHCSSNDCHWRKEGLNVPRKVNHLLLLGNIVKSFQKWKHHENRQFNAACYGIESTILDLLTRYWLKILNSLWSLTLSLPGKKKKQYPRAKKLNLTFIPLLDCNVLPSGPILIIFGFFFYIY